MAVRRSSRWGTRSRIRSSSVTAASRPRARLDLPPSTRTDRPRSPRSMAAPRKPPSTWTATLSMIRSCGRSRARSANASAGCRPWASWKMSCGSSGRPTRLTERGYIMADLNIEAVAKAAGVHRSTVSRAFSRPDAVNAKTREHILRVAEELGYTMSPLAQALRSKTSAFIPLIVPNMINPFFAELATTMTQAAGDRGYQLVLCITNGDNARTAGYLTAMQSLYAPFGIVAPSTRVDIDTLTQYGFGNRVVVIDRVDQHATVPSVTVDNRRGIELAFGHLRSRGHRRVGYVSGISGTYTAQERLDAYHELANGDPIVLDSGTDSGAGERAAAKFLDMTDRPTAII